MKLQVLALAAILLCACSSIQKGGTTQGDLQNAKQYGYQPLDPLPIQINIPSQLTEAQKKTALLDAMPDETIRIAIRDLSQSVGLTYAPAAMGEEGRDYVVVLDYVKFGTDSVPVIITDNVASGERTLLVAPVQSASSNGIIPVYIGVGLRLTANIHVLKGSVNLGSLFALGAAASAGDISGSLVIQTLGISGREISGLIPMPSEISESSIQNAIVALATIKSKIYDDKTVITPRVVGVYNSVGGGSKSINGVISHILTSPSKFPK